MADDNLLYGLYPKDVLCEVLPEILFWFSPDNELAMSFLFLADKHQERSYATEKYHIKKKSDLQNIPLEQLVNDPRKKPAQKWEAELQEAQRMLPIYKAASEWEIKKEKKSWDSELKRVRDTIEQGELTLAKMNLAEYPLSKVHGLIEFIQITVGSGVHTLYERYADDPITQIIGDGRGYIKAKEYQVPSGQVYATLDIRNSGWSNIPSLQIKCKLATYVLQRERSGKWKLLRREVYDD